MPAGDPIRVVCENCGGTDWIAIAIAMVGALIGIGALAYAARAFRVAKDTLDFAETQRDLAQAQHDLERRQFEQEQTDRAARAAFRLTVDLVNADGDILTTDAPTTPIRLRVGIQNIGTLAAGRTTVNVLVPQRYVQYLAWCRVNGARLPDVLPPDTAPEQVGEGSEAGPSAYLIRHLDGIPRRTPVVLYAMLTIDNLEPGEERPLPVRVKAQADELPDDVLEESLDRVVRLRRWPLP